MKTNNKLKVEFVDNSASQYDQNASYVSLKFHYDASTINKSGKLYIGDSAASSYLQLKHRNCRSVVCCSKEMYGYCKEPEVKYMKIDPEEATSSMINETCKFVADELQDGRNVLLFCETGNGKSAAVKMLYFMKILNYDLSFSYKQAQKSRSSIKPKPSLVERLIEMEKKWKGKASVNLDGRQLIHINDSNSIFTRKSNVNPLLIVVSVGLFFGLMYGVLYLITGKA